MPDNQDAFRNLAGSLPGLRISLASPNGFSALYETEGCLRVWPDKGRFDSDMILSPGSGWLNGSFDARRAGPASVAETLYICMLCEQLISSQWLLSV